MAQVSDIFRARWRSREHVGEARPVMRVYVRKGAFRRAYRTWPSNDEFTKIRIPEETNSHAWYAVWQGSGPPLGGDDGPFETWTEIPNVLSFETQQSFENNGITSGTLTIEDVWMESLPSSSPMAAIYHGVSRGYFSPLRGFAAPGFPQQMTRTDWFDFLFRNAQLRVDQGYGEDELVTTFTGLIDDIDMGAAPDRIIVSARDFGQQLVDCRIFGYNKSKHLHDPVIFVDRLQADDKKKTGAAYGASSVSSGHPVRFVADGERDSFWESDHHHNDSVTEYVDVKLPAGRYDSVYVHADDGETLFIGLLPKAGSRLDGDLLPAGWVDGGLGEVPGGNGGWHYIKKVGDATDKPHQYTLNGLYTLKEDSILRLGVRNLSTVGHSGGSAVYAARVRELQGYKRTLSREAKRDKWITVDDPADVVRVLLRWAGFQNWQVEDVGARMKDRLVVNRGDFYVDPIQKLATATGFQFFMGDPVHTAFDPAEDQVINVPIFRESAVLRDTNGTDEQGDFKPVRSVTERDCLTGVKVKLSDEPLAYIIRVRGAITKKEDGGKKLGGDSSTRVMFVYKPPWTTDQRMAGQIKHFVKTYSNLKTTADCEIGCYIVALAMALQSATAVAEVPGNPEFTLDDQVYLVDSGTGIQTRMYVATKQTSFTLGKSTKWTTTLGGALIDTPDVSAVKQAVYDARRRGVAVPPTATGRERQPLSGD